MSRNEVPKIRKLLILEGLHGTGKSTLAASLMTDNRTASFHMGPPATTDPYYEYLRPSVFLEGWNVIYDRGHLGELVWPHIFGRPSLFPSVDGTFRGVEAALQEAASVAEVWYLTGSGTPDRISVSAQERCLEKGLTPTQILDANSMYLGALANSRLDTRIVSWSDLAGEVKRWKSLP